MISPLVAIQAQAAIDGTTIVTSTTDTASSGATAAKAAATAIVFINSDSGEGYLTVRISVRSFFSANTSQVEGAVGDRINLDPWHSGNALIAAVAAVGKPTIVVIHSVGPLILESILALPSVVAVVWASLPGQESGNALVDVLYGSTSPSGKLPYTIAKAQADYGTAIATGDDNYAEGLYIDYRHFDQANIAPRFEFGFGLSYTTFSYSGLSISALSTAVGSTAKIPGGTSKDFDIVATVTCTITNNGTVTGAEVPQLYIGMPASAPASPPKQLRGFTKMSLAPGGSATATFNLRRKDLSYWDTASQAWVLPSGGWSVMVGASSRDIRLTGTLGTGGAAPTTSISNSVSSSKPSSSSSKVSSTATPAPSPTSALPPVPKYGQCGGQTGVFTGNTVCVAGSVCTYSSPYYSQCL